MKADMSRWGLEQEDVHDRARWHSLIELGASKTATRYGHSRLGEKGEKNAQNILRCRRVKMPLQITQTCLILRTSPGHMTCDVIIRKSSRPVLSISKCF